MPETFGQQTKTIILTGPESHKLALEFEAGPHLGKIVFSADLVAADVVNVSVNGHAISPVTYGGNHGDTMAAIITALEGTAHVQDAKLSPADTDNRTIVFYNKDTAETPVIVATVTNGGDGTATATASVVENNILQGMPVCQMGVEELVLGPLAAIAWWGAGTQVRNIGVSIHYALPTQLCTVFVKGYVVTYGKASGTVTPGPVEMISSSDVVMTPGYEFGYCTFASTATATKVIGWSLDGASTTEVIRVLMAY